MTIQAGRRLTVADPLPQDFYSLDVKMSASKVCGNGAVVLIDNWIVTPGTTDPEGWRTSGSLITIPRAGYLFSTSMAEWSGVSQTNYRAHLIDETTRGRMVTKIVDGFALETITFSTEVAAGDSFFARVQQGSGGNLSLSANSWWRLFFIGLGAAA